MFDCCSFRVVSYNILADLYADSDYTREVLFPYCPPYALSIDYRKQLFLKEIIGTPSSSAVKSESTYHPALFRLPRRHYLSTRSGQKSVQVRPGHRTGPLGL